MSNKKKRARIKRRQEEERKQMEASQTKSSRRQRSPFVNLVTGVIFALTGAICVIAVIVTGMYTDNSVGKIINMIVLCVTAAYFLYKSPSYFCNVRKKKS